MKAASRTISRVTAAMSRWIATMTMDTLEIRMASTKH